MPLNELLTLRLAVPLEYAQVSLGECGDWEVLLGTLRPGTEGMESAALFDRRAFITDDPFSGPKALPGPGVIRAAGISGRKTRDSCGQGQGLPGAGRAGAEPEGEGSTGKGPEGEGVAGTVPAGTGSEGATQGSGKGGSFRGSPEGEDGPDRDSPLVIQAGAYAFMQTRAATGSQLAQAVERFARDVWWEKIEVRDEWYLRMVAEDGNLAVQILAAIRTGAS